MDRTSKRCHPEQRCYCLVTSMTNLVCLAVHGLLISIIRSDLYIPAESTDYQPKSVASWKYIVVQPLTRFCEAIPLTMVTLEVPATQTMLSHRLAWCKFFVKHLPWWNQEKLQLPCCAKPLDHMPVAFHIQYNFDFAMHDPPNIEFGTDLII